MSNINKVLVTGRLTKDVDVKEIGKNNTKVANFSVAVNRTYGSGDDRKEETTFLDAEMFGNKAEYFGSKVGKGSRVVLEGRLRQNSFENKEGVTVNKIVVNVDDFDIIDYKEDGKSPAPAGKSTSKGTSTKGKGKQTAEDDSIPF